MQTRCTSILQVANIGVQMSRGGITAAIPRAAFAANYPRKRLASSPLWVNRWISNYPFAGQRPGSFRARHPVSNSTIVFKIVISNDAWFRTESHGRSVDSCKCITYELQRDGAPVTKVKGWFYCDGRDLRFLTSRCVTNCERYTSQATWSFLSATSVCYSCVHHVLKISGKFFFS